MLGCVTRDFFVEGTDFKYKMEMSSLPNFNEYDVAFSGQQGQHSKVPPDF